MFFWDEREPWKRGACNALGWVGIVSLAGVAVTVTVPTAGIHARSGVEHAGVRRIARFAWAARLLNSDQRKTRKGV